MALGSFFELGNFSNLNIQLQLKFDEKFVLDIASFRNSLKSKMGTLYDSMVIGRR